MPNPENPIPEHEADFSGDALTGVQTKEDGTLDFSRAARVMASPANEEPVESVPPGAYMGAKRREDGSWDFSRAARVEVPGHEEEGGPGAQERTDNQEWLDQGKEADYAKLIDYYRDVRDSRSEGHALTRTLGQILNQNAEIAGSTRRIGEEELEGVEFAVIESDAINAIAGQTVKRPIFMTRDRELTGRMAAVLSGDEEDLSSHGFVAPGRYMPEDAPMRRADLIVTSSKGGFHREIPHEMLHSIDPHLGERSGVDHVVTEMAAYYHDWIAGFTDDTFKYEERWMNYGVSLKSPGHRSGHTSQEQLEAVVARCAPIIRATRERGCSDVDIQRTMLQSKTVEEMLEKLDQLMATG